MEDVTTTRPCPLSPRRSRQACTENIVPFRLQPSTASMSASVISASGFSGKTPALAQRTSIPPNRSTAVSASRRQSSTRDTSATVVSTLPSAPAASSSAAARIVPSSRAAISTLAPSRANARAMPLPMPLLPPVTMTERPFSGVNTSLSSVVCDGDDRPSAEAGEVSLGQVAARGGVVGAHRPGEVGAGVRADPGDEQQPPHQDERRDLRLVLGGQVPHGAVTAGPCVGQLGDPRVVLEEA